MTVQKMKLQMILAGVGGQGILFATRIFSELGLKMGLSVMGSETHGMSQRGGSVISHVKLGSFHSPLIRKGTADLLYSFDKCETYRTLKFLRPGGVCFVNLMSEDRFDHKIVDYLKTKKITFRAFDASGEASRLGSIRSANIVLFGFSVGTGLVPFKDKDLQSVLKLLSREKDLGHNLKAFDIGFHMGTLSKPD